MQGDGARRTQGGHFKDGSRQRQSCRGSRGFGVKAREQVGRVGKEK